MDDLKSTEVPAMGTKDVEVSSTNPEENAFCVQCGARLSADQQFCPKCGHKVGQKLNETSGKEAKVGMSKRVKGIIGAAAIVIIAIIIIVAMRGKQAKSITINKDSITVKAGETANLTYIIDPDNTKNKTVTWTSSNESIAIVNNGIISGINEGDCTITVSTKNGKTDTADVVVVPAGPDLQGMYAEYCSSSFAEVASDGSYLSVDTNPSDEDDYIDYEAYLAITSINDALELPESVLNKMNQTRSMDGMQSYSTDELEITWTYHPNKGLEVNYSLK